MRKIVYIILLGLLSILLVATAWGEPVKKEVYYIKKASLSGTQTLRFSLWTSDSEGGEQIWLEEKTMKVTAKTITTYLGDVTPLDSINFSQQLWVKVEQKRKDGSYNIV